MGCVSAWRRLWRYLPLLLGVRLIVVFDSCILPCQRTHLWARLNQFHRYSAGMLRLEDVGVWACAEGIVCKHGRARCRQNVRSGDAMRLLSAERCCWRLRAACACRRAAYAVADKHWRVLCCFACCPGGSSFYALSACLYRWRGRRCA